MYQLYGDANVASFTPHVCLIKANADYEFVTLDMKNKEQHSTDYKKLNPNGQVPVLIRKADTPSQSPLVMFETAAICLYLADQFPEAGLLPPMGSDARAEAYKWLIYASSTIQTEIVVFHYAIRYTSDPEAVDANRKQMAIRQANQFAIIADTLKDGRKFIAGDDPCLVDYYLFMLSEWSHSFHVANGPMSHPIMVDYLARVKALPEITEAIKQEGFTPCI